MGVVGGSGLAMVFREGWVLTMCNGIDLFFFWRVCVLTDENLTVRGDFRGFDV